MSHNPPAAPMTRKRFVAGEPVARDDGRFYVPVNRLHPRPGLSDTVLRIASDAFATVEEAQTFAAVTARLLHSCTHA